MGVGAGQAEARLAVKMGCSNAYRGHLRRLGLGAVRAPGAVALALPQSIQLRQRDPGQASVFVFAEFAELALRNLARGRTAQRVARFVHRSQHLDLMEVLADQPRYLRPAEPGHLEHKAVSNFRTVSVN